MRILFMGTPDFAVESLSKLYENGHNILAVVSQPDRPAGRNMNLIKTPVKEYAESKNLKVYQTDKIKKDEELINTLKDLKPDVIVVVAFGQILSEEILNIPKYGSINVHGSLLPKYRGAAPIQWSVINGDEVTGITTMYMDAGMDTGDMIEKLEVKIEDDDTFGTLYEKMKIAGGKLIIETLEKTRFKAEYVDDNTVKVTIPRYRIDILHEVDIIENIALGYGFNDLPAELPTFSTIANPDPKRQFDQILEQVMIGLGFTEIKSLMLTSEEQHYTKLQKEIEEVVVLSASERIAENRCLWTSSQETVNE